MDASQYEAQLKRFEQMTGKKADDHLTQAASGGFDFASLAAMGLAGHTDKEAFDEQVGINKTESTAMCPFFHFFFISLNPHICMHTHWCFAASGQSLGKGHRQGRKALTP